FFFFEFRFSRCRVVPHGSPGNAGEREGWLWAWDGWTAPPHGQGYPLYRLLIPLKKYLGLQKPEGEISRRQKFRRTDIVVIGKFIGWENRVSRPRIHKSRLFGNRWLPQTTCASQCRTRNSVYQEKIASGGPFHQRTRPCNHSSAQAASIVRDRLDR